jgi:co-chaperonin GroES (HSP10)
MNSSMYLDTDVQVTPEKPKLDFRPLGNWVLVTQEDPNETFKQGGVVLVPDISKNKPLYGYAVVCGSECGWVSEGDRLVFEQYAGKALTLDGKQYLLMAEASIYGIVGEGVKVAVT